LIRRIFGGRAGVIEYCNDDDQGNSVSSSKLGVLGAFGDTTESIRGCDGNGGFQNIIGIKLKLDFHCRRQWRINNRNNLGMQKSSIDGN
jgi:hypothetical protein